MIRALTIGLALLSVDSAAQYDFALAPGESRRWTLDISLRPMQLGYESKSHPVICG